MKYAMGLDNGGTMIKAAIYDSAGNEMAVASRPTDLITPRPGYVERDMEAMWQANCACIKEVLEKSGIPPEDIVGVAVAGHGKGLYAWGYGKPAYNGILSSDNRAWKYPQKWKDDGTHAALYPQLVQQLLPGQQACLLAWLKDHDPQTYASIRWVFSAKDYVRFRLTGEAFSEATDISGSGLLDVKNARFDSNMLEVLGIGEVYDKLPPLRYSYENCGSITEEVADLTGLLAGTPVAGGMFDIDACAIAMDVTSPEDFCTITGTWSINEFIAEQPVTGTAIAMNSLYAIPGYYLIEESSPTGAGNLEWALEALLADEIKPDGKKPYAVANEMVATIAPEECDVYYLPFLYGSNGHPLGRASFVGLTSYHHRGHMLRAVYEGAAYSARVHIDKLLAVRTPPKAIRMAGGAAKAPVWVQIFADVLNRPIETVDGVQELGALGCAMAGFVAAGVYPDYKAAAKVMVRISPPIYPDSQRAAIYQRKYEKYTAVMEALDKVWNRFEAEEEDHA